MCGAKGRRRKARQSRCVRFSFSPFPVRFFLASHWAIRQDRTGPRLCGHGRNGRRGERPARFVVLLFWKKKIACCTHNGDTGTRQRTLTCWSCRMPSGARIKERLGLGCSLLNRLTAGASSCKRRRLKAWLTCRDGVPRLSHHHMWDPNLAIPGDEDQNPGRKSNQSMARQ